MRANTTRNQHFLPRVEQKLNALNPGSASQKFRIYSFRVVNREKYEIDLENPRGHSINKTLSMLDLFSFDVPNGNQLRLNFEDIFHKYEVNVESHTRSLLTKLAIGDAGIKAEIIDLFAAKLLNFIRNPFCIEKVLNTFSEAESYEPTDPLLRTTYRQIVTGRKPHQAHLCAELGISDKIYVQWLRLLFILLKHTSDDQPNLFESIIKSLMENMATQAAAFVWTYDDHCCLLSDRSFSEPISDSRHIAMSFNLSSTAFVDYIFADAATLVPGHALAMWKQRPQATINVTIARNNRDMLVRYNRRVIDQCYERVYSAVKSGLVLV